MASVKEQWAPFAEKYKIHPDTYNHFRRVQELGFKPFHEISLEEARKQTEIAGIAFGGKIDFSGTDREIIVPSPHSENGIPVSVYKPASCPERPAILVYFHGGGFIASSRRTHEAVLKIIARESRAIIVNVEYRLLPRPEAVYAPFDDGLVVTQWVLSNRAVVGGHAKSKVGVGGDSAGGHIAGGVSNVLPEPLDFQVLIYPGLKVPEEPPSVREFADVPGLSKEALAYILANSVSNIPDQASNPRINPYAGQFSASHPETFVLLCQLDPLRDSGLMYAHRLREAGVKVTCEMLEGIPHGFFPQCDTYRQKGPEAYALVARFLNQFHT
ncbi:hormone-sensitive lipase-like [Aplysia californica]|uniref:Hormone-sensitive lipase-like n=1 Tax=Aplysia californica TaxID=6500 RepID=A0ABM0KBD5_APLCA|nr:hormone-sensitive lipase-like [Aplysia californica]